MQQSVNKWAIWEVPADSRGEGRKGWDGALGGDDAWGWALKEREDLRKMSEAQQQRQQGWSCRIWNRQGKSKQQSWSTLTAEQHCKWAPKVSPLSNPRPLCTGKCITAGSWGGNEPWCVACDHFLCSWPQGWLRLTTGSQISWKFNYQFLEVVF